MNELFQIRPILIQAGHIVSIDAGEVGFNHGGCPCANESAGTTSQVFILMLQSVSSPFTTRRRRYPWRFAPISTNAMRQGSANGLRQRWRVPFWTTQSP